MVVDNGTGGGHFETDDLEVVVAFDDVNDCARVNVYTKAQKGEGNVYSTCPGDGKVVSLP